jgi:hypothetical protein
LWENESVQESGTHSILDVDRVVAPWPWARQPFGSVRPVSRWEARRRTGTAHPTRAEVDALNPLAVKRWHGRCAVLHDAEGRPTEIYFWGFSGD